MFCTGAVFPQSSISSVPLQDISFPPLYFFIHITFLLSCSPSYFLIAIRARIALIIHTDITDTIKSTYFNEIASLLSPLWLIKIPHGSQNPILLWNMSHCPPQTISKAKVIFSMNLHADTQCGTQDNEYSLFV